MTKLGSEKKKVMTKYVDAVKLKRELIKRGYREEELIVILQEEEK